MTTPFVCESLDRRDHFAAGGVDPAYLFGLAEVGSVTGHTPAVYQAVAAPGDRTYLLATRTLKSAEAGRQRLLTIIAVSADGYLDRTFGTRGVALTNRQVDLDVQNPGLLKVDGAGRLYFGDATRLLRFRPNGSTDVTFGRHGSADFATADRPVRLCDFTPTDDGVLVATTSTTDGVQRFAVQRVTNKVRTVWQSAYDTGGADDVNGKRVALAGEQAQFAVGGGQAVLVRVQTVGERLADPDASAASGKTYFKAARQDLLVTRFDAAGRGTDVAKKEIHLHDPVSGSVLGNDAAAYPNHGNALLYRQGRSLLVLTDEELVRFDLDTGRGKWLKLPGTFQYDNVAIHPAYQLFADGTVGVQWGTRMDKKGRMTYRIDRYSADGTPAAPGDALAAMIYPGDFATDNPYVIDQIFLSASGRLQFLSTGHYGGSPASLTLRRV